MSNSKHLTSILDVCIKIDQAAIDIYARLSSFAESDALKQFWNKMATEGQSHLDYWQKLKTLAAHDDLPDAFENPQQVIKELEERAKKIQTLQEFWEKEKSVGNAFVIAYRLESYKLHPAFRTLFQYLRPITEDTVQPQEEEKELNETNITDIIATLHKHGEVTPELELIGETLQNLWDQNKTLSKQSMVDGMSGLLNRRGFFFMAKQITYLSKRNRIAIAVLLIEIDDLKAISDRYGPQKGDEVIKIIASKLQATLRNSDLFARYGDDEFIVLLPDTSETGGGSRGRKTQANCRNLSPDGAAGNDQHRGGRRHDEGRYRTGISHVNPLRRREFDRSRDQGEKPGCALV